MILYMQLVMYGHNFHQHKPVCYCSNAMSGTDEIEASEIIIFMHSIYSSMNKTDAHIVFFKDHTPVYMAAKVQNCRINLGRDVSTLVGGPFQHPYEYIKTHSELCCHCILHRYVYFGLVHCTY